MPTTSFSQTISNPAQATGSVQADGFFSPVTLGAPIGTDATHSKGAAQMPFGFYSKPAAYSTNAGTGAVTLTTANVFGGAVLQALSLTGAQSGGVNATTPTAAAWLTAIGAFFVGQDYVLRVLNTGSGQTITLTGGTNVTVTGTATIANNTWREFIVTVTSATAITLQEIGGGSIV